jgi:HTH-type transcriptional regulator/antitoxin HipB
MIYLSTFIDNMIMSTYAYKGEFMRINSAIDLAAAIRGRRLDLGLSQADLAARASVSRVWIATVEGGKRSVNFGMILRLLDAMNLEMDISPNRNLSEVFKGIDDLHVSRDLSDAFKGPSVNLDSLLEEYRGQ